MASLKIPKTYLKIIKKLQNSGITNAIIAGGAIRDLYCNTKVKDIDVFFTYENSTATFKDLKDIERNRLLAQSIKSLELNTFYRKSSGELTIHNYGNDKTSSSITTDWAATMVESQDIESEYDEPGSYDEVLMCGRPNGTQLIKTITKVLYNSYNVDLIELDSRTSPFNYVNEYFDINICKGTFDGTKTSIPASMINDINRKTLTVSGAMTRSELYGCFKNHVPRLLKKFPGYSVVVDVEKVIV